MLPPLSVMLVLPSSPFLEYFEEEIVLNGSNDANLDVASADDFEHHRVLWIESCLHLGGNSLPVTGVIAKLSVSGKMNTMVNKFFPNDPHALTYAFDLVPRSSHGKQLFVDSIGGE